MGLQEDVKESSRKYSLDSRRKAEQEVCIPETTRTSLSELHISYSGAADGKVHRRVG